MKPTLFVLAAGMGSRYGGLKQIDGLGPNGETIMDYSAYSTLCVQGSARLSSLSVRILKRISVVWFSPNTKTKWLARFVFNRLTKCLRATPTTPSAPNHGVPTMPY